MHKHKRYRGVNKATGRTLLRAIHFAARVGITRRSRRPYEALAKQYWGKNDQQTSKSRFLCWGNNFHGVKMTGAVGEQNTVLLLSGSRLGMSGARRSEAQTARDFLVGRN